MATGKETKCMVKAFLDGQMAVCMTVNFRTTGRMAMVF